MDAEIQLAKPTSFATQSYTFIRSFTSPNTRRAYRRDILAFAAYWHDQGVEFDHPGDIGAEHLIAYRDWLMSQPYRRGTVHRKLVPLRSLITPAAGTAWARTRSPPRHGCPSPHTE